MISSPWAAALCGAAAGALTGWASRLVLRRFLASPDRVFYAVFGAGMAVRFLLVAAAVCLLRHENYIIIVLFTAAMILVQMFFEVFPLKHGTKRDT